PEFPAHGLAAFQGTQRDAVSEPMSSIHFPTPPPRAWPVVVAAAIAVAVLAIIGIRLHDASAAPQQSSLAEPAAVISNPDINLGSPTPDILAPDFRLRDQHGRMTSLAQFRGKVVVLAFIDSHCTTICPLTTQSMVDALRLLGPAADKVQLVGVDANPLATRIADVAAYTRAHGMQNRWRFVTGPLTQLQQVWRNYHVYVAAVHNDIDHTPVIYLIGRHGHERRIYITQMSYAGVTQQAELLAEGISHLLPGDPPLARRISLRYLKPDLPSKAVHLYGPNGKTVTLGPSHPHLALFFAGWLKESGRLPAKLAVLDQYAATAHQKGWPAPVAVNELPTEVSPTAGRRLAASLASKLGTPIVEDTDGQLADGYQVQDLPWFALTSNTGRILWQHDGWLSAAALDQQVSTALEKQGS
ncbi:MAG: SCO family protein, partial [Acetobacteraceae bacterium]